MLNIGETSISDLLAWLLDTNWVNEEKNNTSENQIHKKFTKAFLELIKAKEEPNDSILQKYGNKLDELAEGICSEADKNNIDILLTNKNLGFVCVIENKKRAKLSYSGKLRQLQIEKYHNYINEKYPEYKNKKFVYLCGNIEDTQKKIKERLSDVKRVSEDIKQNLEFFNKTLGYKDIKDKDITWALKKFNYTIIEHSEVVLILHQILSELCPNNFDENKILKSVDEKEAKATAKKMYKILYRNPNKDIEKDKISGNTKMRFWERFSINFNYKERLDILCRYVEYWELHNGERPMGDYLYGYTKIIKDNYIWSICEKLSKNEAYWKKVKEIAAQSEKLQEIVVGIERFCKK